MNGKKIEQKKNWSRAQMQQQATHPIFFFKDFIGGGHSHAIVMRMFETAAWSTPNTDYRSITAYSECCPVIYSRLE